MCFKTFMEAFIEHKEEELEFKSVPGCIHTYDHLMDVVVFSLPPSVGILR